MASLVAQIQPQRTYRLAKSVTSIGRGPQNDIRIADATLEERHAHVLKDKDGSARILWQEAGGEAYNYDREEPTQGSP